MQNSVYSRNYLLEYQNSYIKRLSSAAMAVLGGLFFTALLCRFAESIFISWSPTETARQCFFFPTSAITSEEALPSNEEISRFLLSSAFFGNDGLYFDEGEENTGISELVEVKDSNSSENVAPTTPLDEPEAPTKPDGDKNIYEYDYSALPSGELALLPFDLSCNPSKGEVLLSNTTKYEIDIPRHLSAEYPINVKLSSHSEDEPLVLILHTHGTEAFVDEGAISCKPTDIQRSQNTEENIVAVGAVMAKKLNDAGIPTLHCEIMHDLESYQRAYTLAADTIQKYLAEYPSIKYVFDVHRDAIIRSTGELIRPITLIEGQPAAQIMLLVGTDEKGADHQKWLDNFTVASKLQSKLTTAYDRFARPINIRGASFNEQFTPGSLLIEIGSAGNTLSEAKLAAEHLTDSIIELIKENS